MKSIEICIPLLPLLLVIAPPSAKGQLEAVLTPIKLPRGGYGAALTYDGGDMIYLFGGATGYGVIRRYNISSGALEAAGTYSGFGTFGIAETDRDGNPIFLSVSRAHSADGFRDVVRFNRLENTTELLATHDYDKLFAASAKYEDTVLIIGGIGKKNGLLTFDTATHVSTVRANLPSSVTFPTAVRVGKSAFVFSFHRVLKIDLETFSSEIIAPGFPHLKYPSHAVYDGQNIYIIGGNIGRTGIPTGGIIQFNPDNYEFGFVPVENFPLSGSEYFGFPPDSIYVEKMNRIYMFGGSIVTSSGPEVTQDGIWYIEILATPATTYIPPVTTTTRPSAAHRPFCYILPFALFLMFIANV